VRRLLGGLKLVIYVDSTSLLSVETVSILKKVVNRAGALDLVGFKARPDISGGGGGRFASKRFFYEGYGKVRQISKSTGQLKTERVNNIRPKNIYVNKKEHRALETVREVTGLSLNRSMRLEAGGKDGRE